MKQEKTFGGDVLVWILLIGVGVLLTIDLLTKMLFYSSVTGVLNTGGAWGIQIPWILSVVVTFFVIVLLLFAYVKKHISTVPAILLIAGIVGNVYDRLLFHGVRDRFSFQYIFDFHKFFGFTFPFFNVADCCISVGIIILIIGLFFTKKEGVGKR